MHMYVVSNIQVSLQIKDVITLSKQTLSSFQPLTIVGIPHSSNFVFFKKRVLKFNGPL